MAQVYWGVWWPAGQQHMGFGGQRASSTWLASRQLLAGAGASCEPHGQSPSYGGEAESQGLKAPEHPQGLLIFFLITK